MSVSELQVMLKKVDSLLGADLSEETVDQFSQKIKKILNDQVLKDQMFLTFTKETRVHLLFECSRNLMKSFQTLLLHSRVEDILQNVWANCNVNNDFPAESPATTFLLDLWSSLCYHLRIVEYLKHVETVTTKIPKENFKNQEIMDLTVKTEMKGFQTLQIATNDPVFVKNMYMSLTVHLKALTMKVREESSEQADFIQKLVDELFTLSKFATDIWCAMYAQTRPEEYVSKFLTRFKELKTRIHDFKSKLERHFNGALGYTGQNAEYLFDTVFENLDKAAGA
jgi:hypothetical protein